MKNHIFIQARMSSKRLPGKILKKICGKTIIEHIFLRLRKVKNIDKIVLVTGPIESNLALIEEAERLNLEYFCGSEENVLDRMLKASQELKTDNIIRITGDNPLIDFNLINKGLKIFSEGNYDILSIDRIQTYPFGFNFEIFSKKVLEKEWNDNFQKYSNEDEFFHTFISPGKAMLEQKNFKNYDLINDKNLSHIRLTIDYPEDLDLLTRVFEELYPQNQYFGLEEILNLFEKKPKLLEINQKFTENNNNLMSE